MDEMNVLIDSNLTKVFKFMDDISVLKDLSRHSCLTSVQIGIQ